MRNDERLYERYADLLDGEADPGLLRLVGELDGISEGIAPPERLGAATRRALEARAGDLQRGGSAPRPGLARRLFGRGSPAASAGTSRPAAQIWGGVQGQPPRRGGPLSRALGVAGLAAFVVSVAMIALSLSATLSRMQPAGRLGASGQVVAPKPTAPPEVGRLRSLPASLRDIATHVDPGAQRVFLEGSDAQEYDLSRETEGHTLTLELAYADANQIVLGYSLVKPEGSPELWLHPTLTDDRGNKATMVSEYIGQVKGGAIGIIQQFDAGNSAAAEPAPERQELRLMGQLQRHVEESGAGGKASLTPVDVGAPMRFDLSVPLAPSRVLEPNLTVSSGGKRATLERVVIAPSQTRVYLSGDVGKHIITRLSTGGGQAPSLGGYGVWQGWWSAGENATAAAFVDPSLAGERGQWELRVEKVRELVESPYADYPAPVPSTDPAGEGPWVFRFTVP